MRQISLDAPTADHAALCDMACSLDANGDDIYGVSRALLPERGTSAIADAVRLGVATMLRLTAAMRQIEELREEQRHYIEEQTAAVMAGTDDAALAGAALLAVFGQGYDHVAIQRTPSGHYTVNHVTQARARTAGEALRLYVEWMRRRKRHPSR